MKLLILEYVTAGGLGPALGQALLAEADAMLAALARDFAAIDGLRVSVLRCASLPALPCGQVQGLQTGTGVSVEQGLAALLPCHDAVILIAPETDGILHRLTVQVESAGTALWSCRSTAVALASDKLRTLDILQHAGIPCLPGHSADAEWPGGDGPWVIKPVDGCGCEGLLRLDSRAQARQALDRILLAALHAEISAEGHGSRSVVQDGAPDRQAARPDPAQQAAAPPQKTLAGRLQALSRRWMAQPWQPGRAASLSVLGAPGGASLLSVNLQDLQLAADGTVTLQAVRTGALADHDSALAALVDAVHAAIPGLQGIYGIDVLLDDAGARVVEINPRLTSAYPGLAQVMAGNPAQGWFDAMREADAMRRRSARARDDLVLGWDLGGAHVKVAAMRCSGELLEVVQQPCALWQGLDRLHPLLHRLSRRWGPASLHAVTMSGEMVDLFDDRRQGVTALLQAFSLHAGGAPVWVYAGANGLLPLPLATDCELTAAIASANWLASADWAARCLPRGILLDIGSTTTDLLCFAAGQARPMALGDAERLVSGELIYTGLTRTPVMALAPQIDWQGRTHGVMAEWFASSADIYRILGELPEDADQHPSADGGAKTLLGSQRRLARMVGCDAGDHDDQAWQALALAFRSVQCRRISAGLEHLRQQLLVRHGGTAGDWPVVLAGVGRFLLAAPLAAQGWKTIEFGTLLAAGPDRGQCAEHASRCAPAAAVAALALARLQAPASQQER